MTKHIITITRDEDFLKRLSQYREPDEHDRSNAYTYSVECTVSGGCGGWQECGKPHEVDGVDASDGPWETPCSCAYVEADHHSIPWCGEEEFEFHGVLHEWRWGYGWTVPYTGCIIRDYPPELPDGIDTERDGRWLVDDDWDDTDCYLVLVRELGESDE
ncbi:hypothetical protein [Gulosibacter sp. 10]|uniref:hypothetical protein n=1 Tax=Gulosibacter sp. 10 TaxID=1255570 RepID=UPI000B35FB12|nr:hypothetical protein [Gulosibacter sp. 10]